MSGFVEFRDVVKEYKTGDVAVRAADGITFEVQKGEFVVIVGPSGDKTTVLNILGSMDTCDSGKIIVDGMEVSSFSKKQLVYYRRHDIGFVFQFYNLVQNLTALENVELAARLPQSSGRKTGAERRRARRMHNFPAQLSGGEQQQVSIARALKNPKLLLCDEPTGALDDATGRQVLKLLHSTCRNAGMTVFVITHNQAITPIADRIIRLSSGRVRSVEQNDNPMPVERIEW